MKKIKFIFLFFILTSRLLAQETTDNQALQRILEGQLNQDIPGILLHIQSGSGEIHWSGSAGVSEKETGKKLLPDQTFRVASVTKTFVAASILRLWEEGKIRLEDPISNYLSPEHTQILSQDYDLEQIIILQVLQHNAGFFDHTHAPVFFDKVLQPGGHEWTRTEQLKLCVEAGEPIGKPGEKFSYSDTGYIILGEIIERIQGKTLGIAIEEILEFEKLGLQNTAFEGLNPKVDQARIHQYFQGQDTYLFHPSMDYFGGGGLLSTTKDLSQFFLALFKGEVFESPKTLEKMLEAPTYSETPMMDYRIGIYRIEVNGIEAFSHAGFWGTQAIYIPSLDLAVATNYSQIWKGRVPPVFGEALMTLNLK
ncbi:serine hydrolase [Algoriphagus sp. AK58]|uniref:serine hydrolase domain-containing protein n=1 Tax=Algoriphagus sp. AK58 TaxID=1406877 RepID=UPI00164FA156|nr:serine hydrolase domain-containing protein [Algoriphagus sp. AK58]MBC6366830.1 serine hydrolase [Algoriphagus sp. AK58]